MYSEQDERKNNEDQKHEDETKNEDDLRNKEGTSDEDELWTKEDFKKKMTFDERWPLIGCIIYYLKIMFMTPHLDNHSTTDPKPEILSAV